MKPKYNLSNILDYSLKGLMLAIFFLLSVNANSQTKYYVTTDVLNVRSGPGVTFKNVGQLSKGDNVIVYDFSGNWAKLTFNGDTGFVNKKFLQPTAEGTSDTSSNTTSSDNSAIIFLIIVSTIAVGWFVFYAYERRCSSCKKWNVMRTYDSELISAYASRKTVNRTEGNRTITSVPTEVEHYRIYRQCSNCGYKDSVQKRREIEK